MRATRHVLVLPAKIPVDLSDSNKQWSTSVLLLPHELSLLQAVAYGSRNRRLPHCWPERLAVLPQAVATVAISSRSW